MKKVIFCSFLVATSMISCTPEPCNKTISVPKFNNNSGEFETTEIVVPCHVDNVDVKDPNRPYWRNR